MIGDTRLWSSTPFGNRTALLDLLGAVALFHRALAEHVARANEVIYPLFPLGTPGQDVSGWMDAIDLQCRAAAAALNLPQPPDLQSYDLRDEGDWASWLFELGNYHRLLSVRTGLV